MANRSRRRFLEDSLLAAAAMAAAPVGWVFAKDEGQSSAADKLGVAVIGTRGRGQAHIGAFIGRKDTEVTYLCDPDEKIGQQRVEQVAKKQGRKPKFVRDMREIFDDKSVDIVSIATPNHWHSLAGIWAMQAGKDVYVEKPVSHNVQEGRSLVETARKYKRICQAGTQCRSTEGTQSAIEYVHSGKIGEVKLARGLCHRRRGGIGDRGVYDVPKEVDYSLWLGPAPMGPLTRPRFHYDWHWQWRCGNGDLGNQGIHQMDIARWGLGLDRLSDRIVAYGGRVGYGDNEAGETNNLQVAMHEFGDKTLVFEVRNLKTDPLMGAGVGVIFYGSNGYVVLRSYNGGVALDKDGKEIAKFEGGGDHFDNFVKAVRSRKPEELNGEILQGHLSSALCHTGNISNLLGDEIPVSEIKNRLPAVKTNEDTATTYGRVEQHLKDNGLDPEKTKLRYGVTLTFDPKSEKFVGNDKANAMLTRESRKPFIVPDPDKV